MPEPRLAPLPPETWDDENCVRCSAGSTLNIFATLAHHPKLMKRWMVFGNHVLAKSTLPPRDREILILRTGWNCRAPYEWGQHVAIRVGIGITDDDVASCRGRSGRGRLGPVRSVPGARGRRASCR